MNRRRVEAEKRAFVWHDPATTYDPMALGIGARLLEARRPTPQEQLLKPTKLKLQA